MAIRKPDFFIVGAPKCGTTAMNDYLAAHPDIFMAEKEIHYFGSDLDIRFDKELTEEWYLGFFQERPELLCGEASVWYLFSDKAATEIKAFQPNAKIIIQLRNPADMAHSLHSENIFNGFENLTDFEQALDAEPDRWKGGGMVKNIEVPKSLWYTRIVSYTDQVQRYFDVFGKANVRVIIFEDLLRDTQSIYRNTLEFLGVDTSFEPDFEVINANKKVANEKLHMAIKHPPTKAKKVFRAIVPHQPTRHKIMEYFYNRNISTEKRPPLELFTRKRINKAVGNDVKRLKVLLDRQLSDWGTE